ncbi:RecQ family ATP-dependent DNA helicase [Ectobacillus ponti]|uniref:DNA 3'-5' helicase n=1 Tax=Ectobacillus ponti TaxID=2961894 RepID=A0AA41X9L9_9BACI|nr:RecQ family ATP-dependent DNA helicase [Ectobacillus ponti]MCP8971242.1 RecQ family ATP-dependent DNA helicase [Ectobacillus ponti]
MSANPLFKQLFPQLHFNLKEFQDSVIQKVLGGVNTLCIMPTGGGKSLIYWVGGLGLKGVTIVISPLTALIDEQALRLEEHGYTVMRLHTGVDSKEQITQLKQFYHKEFNPDFIFASPERISTDGLFEHCIKQRKDDIKLIAIDEIHCISQWGHSFRPFYQHIPTFLNRVYGKAWPTVLGLSATLDQEEITDICNAFHIENKSVIKSESLIRSEIELKKLKFSKENEKVEKLWQLLRIHKEEKVLVYVYRVNGKNSTEELAVEACQRGYRATYFHSGLSSEEKQEVINRFKNNELSVVFATNAFGMGIDIPDIRVVIHFLIPESIAQYYQEVGRASRDQLASNAYLLYSDKNIDVKRKHFIDKSFPSTEELQRAFVKMTNHKKGYHTLPYFDDKEIQKCLPYFVNTGMIDIIAKSIMRLDVFSEIYNAEISWLHGLTTTKNIITTMKKSGKPVEEISHTIFEAIVHDEVRLEKSLGKCLIIYSHIDNLDKVALDRLKQCCEIKRQYKHDQLDHFLRTIESCESSKELHQEIGRHLGVPKFLLDRIYITCKGDLVRSKSEVIIANLLYQHDIEYEYEKKLYYGHHQCLIPDFTLYVNGQEFYWEHLGMIGFNEYDARWLEKKSIYELYFPNQLLITYENATLTTLVKDRINSLFSQAQTD